MAILRWDVWLANLDPVIGSEQGKTRPVLVLSKTKLNDILPVVNILPLTSLKPGRRIYPNEALIPPMRPGSPMNRSCCAIRSALSINSG
jgi:mRNA interferase MazF